MLTETSSLSGLIVSLRELDRPLMAHWAAVHETFRHWVERPDFRTHLRNYVLGLPAAEVAGRARETTTHFAWCLLDDPSADFSLWLHEYKPQRDWRLGYADSVHNHRYHFSSTMVHGSYLQEHYDATVDPESGLITSVAVRSCARCAAGSSGTMLAADFHRIVSAEDDTMTFLVKSRPVTASSLSYDIESGVAHRHVPVENRLGGLSARI
ncbi:hypothetical protein [Amycolatopsis taiwanensis]|uniref:Uncharacterized protein n=1 Tax=Amycolatopsis taiwanensis TaxID=342230 RepID=A0A9W6VGE8_9PSEU|nr:hypothetical protein [Amycolatopsis taiwanensis]GLY65889.1 hypothetical protein Atai01_25080 [Amycolatopsis taiwanensis]